MICLPAIAALKAVLLEHCEELRRRFGGKLPVTAVPSNRTKDAMVELVFPSETGGPLDGDNFRKRCAGPVILAPRTMGHNVLPCKLLY